MAVRRHSNFDKTVLTIADRNAIEPKVDGMVITVLDSIADPDAGSGKAIYRWVESDSTWNTIYKSVYRSMSFETEELTIINGLVVASYVPMDNKIWGISVVSDDIIIAEPRIEDLTISSGNISGLSAYNGYKLRFTYGYGSITQQLNIVLETKVDDSTNVIGTY
jgi:hypothetical protein